MTRRILCYLRHLGLGVVQPALELLHVLGLEQRPQIYPWTLLQDHPHQADGARRHRYTLPDQFGAFGGFAVINTGWAAIDRQPFGQLAVAHCFRHTESGLGISTQENPL